MKTPKTPTHFVTSNTMLALALDVVGIRPLFILNAYTPEILKRLNCTAREAWKRGDPGKVMYYFPRSEALKEALAAWDDQQRQIMDQVPTTEIDVEIGDAMRILCTALKRRREFNDLWMQETPRLLVPYDGEEEVLDEQKGTTDDGREVTIEKTVRFPGFRLVSIDMPEEQMKEVGL